MDKKTAINLLGGTVTAVADAIGITYQAVHDWPDVLSARIEDRVYAALARKAQKQSTPEPTATPDATQPV